MNIMNARDVKVQSIVYNNARGTSRDFAGIARQILMILENVFMGNVTSMRL